MTSSNQMMMWWVLYQQQQQQAQLRQAQEKQTDGREAEGNMEIQLAAEQVAPEDDITVDPENSILTLPSGEIYDFMAKCIEESPTYMAKQLTGEAFTKDEIESITRCANKKKLSDDNMGYTIAVIMTGFFILVIIVFLLAIFNI